MKRWQLAQLESARTAGSRPYAEFLRLPAMSAGLYVLPAGGVDRQLPHTEDEIYVVMRGRSRFTSGGQVIDVAAGDVIFVPVAEEHRFHEISEELVLVVAFGPAEGSGGDVE